MIKRSFKPTDAIWISALLKWTACSERLGLSEKSNIPADCYWKGTSVLKPSSVCCWRKSFRFVWWFYCHCHPWLSPASSQNFSMNRVPNWAVLSLLSYLVSSFNNVKSSSLLRVLDFGYYSKNASMQVVCCILRSF